MKQSITIQRDHEVLSLVGGIAYSRVPSWYGATARDLKMDLIIPKNRAGRQSRPAVVWICGGAFCVMDRSVWIPELIPLARSGFVVASIDHRTCNEGAFPAQLIDVKAAIRFLKANADEFCVDPDRICVMGESAGGTLACLAGLTGERRELDEGHNLHMDSAVRAVVDLYGITDFQAMRERMSGEGVPRWALDALLDTAGNESSDPAGFMRLIAQGAPPFLILHGDKDSTVPIGQSETLYRLLAAKSIDAWFYRIAGGAHGDDLFFQEETMRLILNFLQKQCK